MYLAESNGIEFKTEQELRETIARLLAQAPAGTQSKAIKEVTPQGRGEISKPASKTSLIMEVGDSSLQKDAPVYSLSPKFNKEEFLSAMEKAEEPASLAKLSGYKSEGKRKPFENAIKLAFKDLYKDISSLAKLVSKDVSEIYIPQEQLKSALLDRLSLRLKGAFTKSQVTKRDAEKIQTILFSQPGELSDPLKVLIGKLFNKKETSTDQFDCIKDTVTNLTYEEVEIADKNMNVLFSNSRVSSGTKTGARHSGQPNTQYFTKGKEEGIKMIEVGQGSESQALFALAESLGFSQKLLLEARKEVIADTQEMYKDQDVRVIDLSN